MRRVRARLAVILGLSFSAAASISAHAEPPHAIPTQNPDGWTDLEPSWDSRVIYVSSSMGDDANDGLSPITPKRTIHAGKQLLRFGEPDWICLRSGDVFYESFGSLPLQGRSEFEPMVVTSYGTGPRPLLLTGTEPGIVVFGDQPRSYFAIVGLAMRAHKWNGMGIERPVGIDVLAAGTSMLIEDCHIEGYLNSVVVQGNNGTRVDVAIRRNVLVDPVTPNPNGGGANIFVSKFDGLLIEENVLDYTRASEARGGYVSHNAYVPEHNPSSVIVRGNIAHNAGRGNFSIRPGGTIDNNLSIRGAMGFALGVANEATYPQATIIRNVVTESRNNVNGQPLGVGFYIFSAGPTTIANNIITRCTDGQFPWAIVADAPVRSLVVSRNVVWRWLEPQNPNPDMTAFKVVSSIEGPVRFTANQVQQPGNSICVELGGPEPLPPGHVTFDGNAYYSLRTDDRWFRSGIEPVAVPQWPGVSGEYDLRIGPLSYADPDRSIATYHVTQGGAPSVDAFMAEAKRQRRGFWRPAYTAASVNAYFRAGFVEAPAIRPPGDCNGDGRINELDRALLQEWIREGDWQADLNRNGVIGVDDVATWISSYARVASAVR